MTKQEKSGNAADEQNAAQNPLALVSKNDLETALANPMNSPDFEAVFAAAEASQETTQDLSNIPILAWKKGEVKTLFYTGEKKSILFRGMSEPKNCPIFLNKEKIVEIAAQVVIVSAFNKQDFAPGFYRIECTGSEKSGLGEYQLFTIKQVNLELKD